MKVVKESKESKEGEKDGQGKRLGENSDQADKCIHNNEEEKTRYKMTPLPYLTGWPLQLAGVLPCLADILNIPFSSDKMLQCVSLSDSFLKYIIRVSVLPISRSRKLMELLGDPSEFAPAPVLIPATVLTVPTSHTVK